MSVPSVKSGVRSLKGVAEASSPNRVLDLHAVALEFGDDPAYLARPLFDHPLLNKGIIAKARVRPGEERFAGPARVDMTKVIFLFDQANLDFGGQRMIVDGQRVGEQLAAQLDYRRHDLQRDTQILALFDRLPSVDPFLAREAIRRMGFEVADCYFQFKPGEEDMMRSFVSAELAGLVKLCFPGGGDQKAHCERMTNLILEDDTSAELTPLRKALHMGADEFSKAMFAWKGFLYYRWKVRDMSPGLRMARRAIASIPVGRCQDNVTDMLRSAKALADKAITAACDEVGATLRIYGEAYLDLVHDQKPERFRAFLDTGPDLFIDLGVRIGQLEQLVSVWTWRFSSTHIRSASADQLLEALRDLLQEVSAPAMSVILVNGQAAPDDWRQTA